MKKTLLSLSILLVGFAANSQTIDTIANHAGDVNTLTFAGLDNVAPIDSGYVGGSNIYGDLTKMQLFDPAHGVVGNGSITGVAYLSLIKGGAGNVIFSIHADNAGQPVVAPLGSVTVNLTAVDTTGASLALIGGTQVYNNVATFASPVAIPANKTFWVNCTLPTGASLFSLVCSTPFADAATHTAEFWSDNSFHTFGDPANWGFDGSLCLYPIVNFTSSIQENVISATVSPNPTSDVLNINAGEEVATVKIVTLDGKEVAIGTSASVNVSELSAGVYVYNVTTISGKIATGKFTKK